MKRIHRILIVLFIMVLTFGIFYNCQTLNDRTPYIQGTHIVTDTTYSGTIYSVYGLSMKNAFEREFTLIQFDSICKADNISKDLTKWHSLSSKDGETNEIFTQYLYITYKGNQEIVYRLIKIDNSHYKITKRITSR